ASEFPSARSMPMGSYRCEQRDAHHSNLSGITSNESPYRLDRAVSCVKNSVHRSQILDSQIEEVGDCDDGLTRQFCACDLLDQSSCQSPAPAKMCVISHGASAPTCVQG